MTPAYGTSTVVAEGTRANTVYAAPASIADGDLLIIVHEEFNATALTATTPPSGFVAPAGTWPIDNTANGVHLGTWMWSKIASGESGNYTVNQASTVTRGMMIRVTGADTANPFAPNLTQNKGSGSTSTWLSLTTTIDGELILAIGVDNNDLGGTLAAPAGTTPTFTLRIDDHGGNYLATGLLSPAGATGNKTAGNNTNAVSGWNAILAAIQPSVPADNTTKPGMLGEIDPDLRGAWF